MGLATNLLIILHVYQILLISSIVGLPFASISALPSLPSAETASSDDTQASQVSILLNNENVLTSSPVLTSPSKNFQLVIGLPFGNDNYLTTEGANSDTTSDKLSISLQNINRQPNAVQNPVSETTSSTNDVKLDMTPPSGSVLIVPKININSSNGFKRELRDTMSVSSESCLSSNSPLTFSSTNTLPQMKSIFPSFKSTGDLTQYQQNICVCGNAECSNSIECDCTLSNPSKGSSLFTNFNQNPNMLSFNAFNNEESTFANLKNYINSRQCVQCSSNSVIQDQPNVESIETKISPSDMIRLNNNLLKAKALQNNMYAQSNINNDAKCENSVNQNNDFMNEYQNLLRIRNNVIPKMLSENVAVKSFAQNNNDNFQGCPQLESVTVQSNIPFIQNNCETETTVPYSFNNIARIIKDNMNENNNNNLGCPQLRSIPIYNKESLINKQAFAQNQNNICFDQDVTQNTQGCPQLLAIAQNSLYQTNNNEANNIYEQNCNCANECQQNIDNNCNCIQMFTPNDNLAQAIQMINLAKTNQAKNPSASINILPYGETLLDGKPIGNNYISLDSLSCPAKLPTCSCTNLCNSQNTPISITPVNPSNIMITPSVNSINTSPVITNFPTCNTQFSQSFAQPFSFDQNICFNNNIQSSNPIVSPTFIPIQSLTQVPFVNNVPSTISISPSLSDTCISPISSLPSVCTSLQPIVTPPYPLLTSNVKQTDSLSGASVAFTPINKIVNSLTKNILSTLISKKIPSSAPLSKLPPVNPYTDSQAPFLSILPISDLPVACNEYVPPMYTSVLPMSSFNPSLFCVESDTCDSCVPYALSITDTYYPEASLMFPALPSDYPCSCGSLFSPATLPQASSVIKMNNLVNIC